MPLPNRLIVAALAWMLPAGAVAEPVTYLIDIRHAGPQRVAELAASGELTWWLELGETMLVSGDRAALARLPEPVLESWPALDPEDLQLEARGCGVEPGQHLPALAWAGRQALIRVPRALAHYPRPAGLERHPVTRNQVLARLWHNDPDKATAGSGAHPLAGAMAAAVDSARWHQRFSQLAGFDRNTFGPGRIAARDWLVARFQEIPGVATVSTPAFNFFYASQSYSAENVLAQMPGRTRPDEWVIVGGHYDSRNTGAGPGSTAGSPGAEDNASGCAGVIEMAEVLSRFPPERSVLFMCYAGEEQGLHGSIAHAQSLQTSGNAERVVFMLNMDMIAYSGDNDLDVLIESTSLGQPFFARFATLAASFAPSLRIVTSLSPCCSDHMPYLGIGRPAVLTIANDWNVYAHYHRSTDVPDNVTNAQAMAGGILRMNAAFLAETALATDTLFADGFE